ncbi:hypothetical protein JY651_36165 [Pyxidicoccus parkwayensis]|uniref:Lipoprotein n=2 Tax=Pyxidicoccus parkwayensis TaxID=2813578 RepID=A0ABX7PDA5_9BACT|nr:hypothetical protein JY651_36165 [Pyxidicoccus parkwaysis]
MRKACAVTVLVGTATGCHLHASKRRQIEWPDEASTELVAPSMEAGAALAAAAAIRELIQTNTDPRLFSGCSSPEQGLNAVVFKHQASGLYFVVLEQRFDRCGGPSGRVLDWWHEYAVTPQGEIVAEAPQGEGEAPAPPVSPSPPTPEPSPSPGPQSEPAAMPPEPGP